MDRQILSSHFSHANLCQALLVSMSSNATRELSKARCKNDNNILRFNQSCLTILRHFSLKERSQIIDVLDSNSKGQIHYDDRFINASI